MVNAILWKMAEWVTVAHYKLSKRRYDKLKRWHKKLTCDLEDARKDSLKSLGDLIKIKIARQQEKRKKMIKTHG